MPNASRHFTTNLAKPFLRNALAGCLALILAGCATGRDMTSPHYLPEWENRVFNVPNPSETSAGFWVVKVSEKVAYGTGRALLIPFALLGNVALNAYLIPTWPFRWLFRGDKRLLVWVPVFHVGEDVGSSEFSKAWNRDLV